MGRLIAVGIFLIWANTLFSQSKEYRGVVTDDDSNPVIGANIKAGNIGTTTDIEGAFTIQLSSENDFLEISYIGYDTKHLNLTTYTDGLLGSIVLVESNVLLNTATVTASRFEQRLAESSVSIDVIKPQLLANINANTVDAALDKIPGVQILENQANIRGGSGWSFGAGSRVMLLIDDIPALQADSGTALFGDIPVENIAQIEVVKGAASAIYGSSALNGIINFRTAYATSEPVTKASVFSNFYLAPKDKSKQWWTGTPSDIGLTLSHKQKFGKLDFAASTYYYKRDSLSTYAQETFRDKFRFNTNLRYRITDKFTVGVNSIFNFGNSSNFLLWFNGSSGAYRPFINAKSSNSHTRYSIDPYVRYFDKHNNRHALSFRFYQVENRADQAMRQNASLLKYGDYQFQRSFDRVNIKTTAGIAAILSSSNSEVFSDTLIRNNNYAVFAQLDKKFANNLNLTIGGRFEQNVMRSPEEVSGFIIPDGKVSEGKFISRVGANYELAEYSFVRASFGQGYRFPTIAERFLTTSFSGFTIFPNPSLESETGWSSEIGIKNGFKIGPIQGFVDLSMFISEYSNMMEFTFVTIDGVTGFQSQNIGDTRIQGYEIGVSGQSTIFDIPVNFFGGYTYIDPVYKNFSEEIRASSSVDENILKYRTKHQFSFDVQAEYKGFSAGAAVTAASHLVAIDRILNSLATIGAYREFNNSGYRKFDFRIAYEFKFAKLSLLLNNANNEEYTERPALLEPPRHIGLRMDFKL